MAAAPARPSAPSTGFELVTVPENPEEKRAFLQGRVALFGKILAICSGVFLATTMATYFLLAPNPSLVRRLSLDKYDLASIGMFAAIWAMARVRRLSRRTLEVIEIGATVLSCLGYSLMVAGSREAFNMLIPVLTAAVILMARAVFIPTTPRRTMVVSLVGVLPSVVVVQYMASRLGTQTSIPQSIGPTIYAGCWAGLIVALSTITSRIIYGLEQKVREARQLGQYTLDERLGAGGMGVVYRASHAMLRRATAVKVLPPEKMGRENVLRFEREVQLTSQLTHPNTISIYDYGRTPDGLFYYAMEYLDGITLTDLVEAAGPLPPGRVAWLMRQVCGSIDEAHRIGLIHRDIKPDNIMVCDRGGVCDLVKVLDFGLVKELQAAGGGGGATQSQMEGGVGTPLYMSPEAITSPRSIGIASDLYSLGAVGYFLVAGRHVFEGRSLVEICAHHLATVPQPPSRVLGRAVPAELEAVLLSCLAKDPAQRPATAGAVERTLAAVLAAHPWTQEDARAWWSAHGEHLRSSRAPRAATTGGASDPPPILRSAYLDR